MRALVLDQSTTTCGFCAVAEHDSMPVSFGVTGQLLGHGIITAPKKALLIDRLAVIQKDLYELIRAYRPDELVIENTMYLKQKTGRTNHAMSAIFLLCQQTAKKYGLQFYTQHPKTIKEYSTGNGDAEKDEMIEAAIRLWGLSRFQIKDDNHADSLCAAYVWLMRGPEVRRKDRA